MDDHSVVQINWTCYNSILHSTPLLPQCNKRGGNLLSGNQPRLIHSLSVISNFAPLTPFLHPPLCLFFRRSRWVAQAAVLPRSAQAKCRARTPESLPIPSYFIVLQQTSFLYFLIWCIAFTMPLLCSIVHHSAGSNAERLWNDRRLFVGVVEERSAAVAVMTLSVDPPASSQQRSRQKFATEWIIFIKSNY